MLLPFGAAAPPSRCLGGVEGPNAGPCAWPDEHCAWLREDPPQWEAALSRIGLWSSSLMGTSDSSPYSYAQPTLTTSVPGKMPQLAITHQGNDLCPSTYASTLHLPVKFVSTASAADWARSNRPLRLSICRCSSRLFQLRGSRNLQDLW